MRGRTRAMLATVGVSLVALVAAACGGGTGEAGNQSGEGTSGGIVTMAGCTPQQELLPGNTNETCGGNVFDAISAKLMHYNADDAAPELDIAESIDSDDNQNFTVKLKEGYKFSDGTEVKAHNFVDAWNYTAYCPNGQANSYFFSVIQGFADVQSDEECTKKPAKKKMSGLKVVDDYTFTIKTNERVSNLPLRLGYTAFSPLPDSFLDGDEAAREEQGKLPVGAGPFKVVENTATKITLERNEHYAGEWEPSIDGVEYKIYTDMNTAYNDVLANNTDFTDTIPDDYLVGDQFKSDLPDRNLVQARGALTWLTFSPIDSQLKDNEELRRAISMAIDRDAIIKNVFNGTFEKATGWVSPVVDGYNPGACGESCEYDPEKAKQMFTDAGGYDGTLVLTYNADGDHKVWAEAAANSIKNTLGVDCVAKSVPTFADELNKLDNDELEGVFRNGWQMDYPSIENFLAPIYSKGADSNYARWNNPKFSKTITQAAAAQSPEKANKLYQDAEQIIAEDFPTAPLWYDASIVGWSENVTNVKVTAFGTLDLTSIKKVN